MDPQLYVCLILFYEDCCQVPLWGGMSQFAQGAQVSDVLSKKGLVPRPVLSPKFYKLERATWWAKGT